MEKVVGAFKVLLQVTFIDQLNKQKISVFFKYIYSFLTGHLY